MAVEARRFADRDVVDAVVIGTGAGGAPILMRLAEAGLDVVALEAGRAWAPERDFATDELAQEALFWKDERLCAGADPIPFGRNNSGTGVGGSTLHWTAYAPRPRPEDFRLNAEFGVGRDWPLGYAELEPYFDEVEAILGVSGPSPYPWGPPRRPYPLPPAPLNGASELMARGGAAIGMKTAPGPNAVLSRPYASPGLAERPACLNRGFCQAGCRNRAKGSTDVTFVPRAVKAGAEVRALSFAVGFEQNSSGRLSAVVYRDAGGEERRQRCRHVFLCAGAVESPRLLLMSGLANGSDQVGRNFMAHPGLQVWGVFDELVRPTRGVPGGAISEDTHRPADADFAGGYLVQSLGVMPVTYVAQLARAEKLWGPALVDHMAKFNHMAGVNILGECLPHPDNRLTLSEERDRRGLPKPLVTFSAGDNETRMNAHAERLLHELWTAAGARELHKVERYAHALGTCRMGPDGDEAVVDADCRAFGLDNLYVCDNSVYPSSLPVNPALVQMALSLRVADRFLAQR